MLAIFLVFLALCVWPEGRGNPNLTPLGADQAASGLQSGGNMEDK